MSGYIYTQPQNVRMMADGNYIIIPGQCPSCRRPRLRDLFWSLYWKEPIESLTRCYRYEGHEQYPDQSRHRDSSGREWQSDQP